MTMTDTRVKLELALSSIDAAIGELYGIDGMESYYQQLNDIAMEIDAKIEGIEE